MALTKIGTDGIKDDAVTSDKVANAINSAIAANTAKTSLEDESVTLAKLEHGTSSNDGKFLRANNGADPTFETITGTTINNNADNRVITGSGTANTLEGESNLTFNGTKLSLTPPANTGNDGLEIIPAGGSTASSFKVKGNQSAGAATGRNGGVVEIDANYYVAASDIFTIKSRGTTVLNMLGSGNLGLGTANPANKLRVEDSNSGVIIAKQTTNNGGYNTFEGKNSSGVTTFYTTHNGRVGASEGVIFGSDTAAGNVLDDYEEGTWTPRISAGGTAFTVNDSGCQYVRIGSLVFIEFDMNQSNGGPITNIFGLPFGVFKHSSFYLGFVTNTSGGLQGTTDITGGRIDSGANCLILSPAGGSNSQQLASGQRIIGSGCYVTDS